MTEEMSKSLREYVDKSRENLRLVMHSAYGYARITALVSTVVFISFYVLSLINCYGLNQGVNGSEREALILIPDGLIWSYLVILGVFEFFKIIKRMADKSCTFSLNEKDVCDVANNNDRDPISVRIAFLIWPFSGLNKFIFFAWSVLAIAYQVVYGYQMYRYGEVFVPPPDTFWKAFLGVSVACTIGLLNNALFIFRTPGFKNFLESVASIALHKEDFIKESMEKMFEEAMWKKRQEWKPLDDVKCKKCVGDLSHELLRQFPEIGEMKDERVELLSKIFKDIEHNPEAKKHLRALIQFLASKY